MGYKHRNKAGWPNHCMHTYEGSATAPPPPVMQTLNGTASRKNGGREAGIAGREALI